jgi:hypothetical protein
MQKKLLQELKLHLVINLNYDSLTYNTSGYYQTSQKSDFEGV